jgi:ankyrin repeat protein
MAAIAARLAVDEPAPGPPDPRPFGPEDPMSLPVRPIVQPPPEPRDVPVEMRTRFIMRLHDGVDVPTPDVWSMLMACRDGDLARVTDLVAACPSIVRCAYNYMPPLHLAVREGHVAIVRFLAERGAVNPKHRTYPYHEPLLTVANDRGYAEIAAVLEEYARTADPDRPEDEGGRIDYETDFERRRFQRIVSAGDLRATEAMLDNRPELATDPFAFWSEGVLSVPANGRDRRMIDLLMDRGARVPDISKWGMEYYFKHQEIAEMLMDRGMNPAHANCHRTTLLHEMARIGDVRKAQLLLDHGAEIDAIDQEFRSTPLGFAARWGRRSMVAYLLRHGAAPNLAGAPWATPLAWATKKNHSAVAADLRQAGATA